MSPAKFNPYAILAELEQAVSTTSSSGAGPSDPGLGRGHARRRRISLAASAEPRPLQRALENLDASRVEGQLLELAEVDPGREPVIELTSDAGEIKVVLQPAGTRGYEDLRHRANREPLGRGLRPSVASPGDLVRMLEAYAREPDPLVLEKMRRVLELDRGLSLGR